MIDRWIDGLARTASKEYTSGSSINNYAETKVINLRQNIQTSYQWDHWIISFVSVKRSVRINT